ncbi:zinc finger protein 99-like isoform X2 [Xenia sp. Carnegie-2017]|uniref:zinc finger protein 99-like isoform X2 n=1 Tax=Xenia sp. Carnegie-2017 TaxID=2897299 RepID=UPI001F046DC0|nr:zinc finger protein 99-like isoform X2 [Xenia sp. Carnegie-2017]
MDGLSSESGNRHINDDQRQENIDDEINEEKLSESTVRVEIVDEDGAVTTAIEEGQVAQAHHRDPCGIVESNDNDADAISVHSGFQHDASLELIQTSNVDGAHLSDPDAGQNNMEELQHNHDGVKMTSTLITEAITNLVFSEAGQSGTGDMIFTTTQDGSQELMTVRASIDQETIQNITMAEAGTSSEGGEMVFTVVAVDNNINSLMEIVPHTLSNNVQLSLVQPPVDGNEEAHIPANHFSNVPQLTGKSVAQAPQTIESSNVSSKKTSRGSKQDHEGSKNEKSRVLCDICKQDFSDLPSMRRHRMIHFDVKPYKCEFCEKSFRRKDNLREHRNIHTQENLYKCDRCGKVFPRKYTHKVHMARHCGRDAQNAQQDVGNWNGDDQAPKAKQNVVTKSSEPCQICFKTFRDASTLKRHMLTHSDHRPYKCQECDKAFRRKDHLNEHVVVHKMVRPFSCRTCGKSFSRKNGLKTHMIRTSHLLGYNDVITPVEPKDPEVETADQVIASDDLVVETFTQQDPEIITPQVQHVEATLDEANHPPADLVVNSFELSESTQKVKAADSDSFIVSDEVSAAAAPFGENENNTFVEHPKSCQDETTVDKGTSQISTEQVETEAECDNLKGPNNTVKKKRKRSNVSDRNEQSCNVCNKVFRDATSLKRHALVHSGERPHKCNYCEKRFRRRDHLKSHETSHHSGITAHKCTTCDATFNTRYALTVHVKCCKIRQESPSKVSSTTEEVKITGAPESKECPVCHKVFKDPSTQRRHFRIHSNERPFQCEICAKCFRRKDNLREHQLCHSDEKPFSCTDCGKSLSRRSSLTNHMNVCPARKVALAPTLTSEENAMMQGLQFSEAAVQSICVNGDPQEISAAHLLATGLTTVVTPSDVMSFDVTSSGVASSNADALQNNIEQGIQEESDGQGEKPHACTTCERQFRQTSHLKVHERTHSGERPFHCHFCDRAFIDSSTMKRHERLHNEPSQTDAVIANDNDVMQSDVVRTTNNDNMCHGDVMSHETVALPDVSADNGHSLIVKQAHIVRHDDEVCVSDESAAIQLLVTTTNELGTSDSSQPISTSVVVGLSKTGTNLDENNLGQILRECIRNQEVAEKIRWQQNHPNETVEQLIYIRTETPTESE